jgi:hypothetical protein
MNANEIDPKHPLKMCSHQMLTDVCLICRAFGPKGFKSRFEADTPSQNRREGSKQARYKPVRADNPKSNAKL